jgi:hypothetical protein
LPTAWNHRSPHLATSNSPADSRLSAAPPRGYLANCGHTKTGTRRAPVHVRQRQRPPWRFAHGHEYSVILRGVRDDGSQASASPTTAAFGFIRDRRIGITDGRDANPTLRTRPCPAVAVARTTTATSIQLLPTSATYHQSYRGCVVADCAGAGVSALADVTAVPISPKNTPASTASASRRTRGVNKLTPFTRFGTASSQPNSPLGSGIRHATHRIDRARAQTQTLLLAASCLSPTAMRMAT